MASILKTECCCICLEEIRVTVANTNDLPLHFFIENLAIDSKLVLQGVEPFFQTLDLLLITRVLVAVG